MKKLEYGKKYTTNYFKDESEAVYLGMKYKKNLINRHFFMIWNPIMQPRDRPLVVGCASFKIKPGNKLELQAVRKYFPNLNKNEKNYLVKLSLQYLK